MKTKKLITSVAVAGALLAPAVITAIGPMTSPVQTVHAASAINDLIAQNGYKVPSIETMKSTFTQYNGYRKGVGKPEGVVIHDTANDNSTIYNEISYMQNNWSTSTYSYVHAFVDANHIINIHPTDYTVWGAGPYANARFVQIELVHAHSTADFAKSVNNDAWYVAYLLKQYGLPLDNAASDGVGTVWSHKAVSLFLGGTDHVDPDGYFAKWGYDMTQFYQLVSKHYANLGGSVTPPADLDTVVSTQDVNKQATVNGTDVNGVFYLTANGFESFGMSSQFNGQSFTVTKLAKTKKGLEMALLTRDGKQVAWIQSNWLTYSNPDKIVSRTPINEEVTLNNGAAAYYLLSDGFQQFTTANGQKATAVEKATTQSGVTYYLIKQNGSNWGWMKAADTTAVNGSDDPVQQPASLQVTVNNGAPLYYLMSDGFQQFSTANYGNKNFKVIRKATAGSKEYYLLSEDGSKGFAWVPTSNVTVSNGGSNTEITNVNGTGTINYVPGYGVLMLDAPAGNHIGGRYLQHGTSWKVFQKAVTADGSVYYNLGGNQWLSAKYLIVK